MNKMHPHQDTMAMTTGEQQGGYGVLAPCPEQALPVTPAVGINMMADKTLQCLAEQHLEAGRYREALHCARQAARVNPAAWQSLHTAALAMRMLGRLKESLRLLARLYRRFPQVPVIRRDFGDYICKSLGDWTLAGTIWQPIQHSPQLQRDMAWFRIKRQIYDGTRSTEHLVREIRRYAEEHITRPGEVGTPEEQGAARLSPPSPPVRGGKRRRIGLIATFLYAGPVYYLSIGALRHLAADYDLIFFARETIDDWATQEFKGIARAWHWVKGVEPGDLARLMRKQELDVLIDMCGWLDTRALQALTTRPARQIYKWIGGQSTTTGLDVFDGYLGDCHQSPRELQHYYSEPLILLESGYASYTPPPYMPGPRPSEERGHWEVGIISHPMKVSQWFLKYLREQMEKHLRCKGAHPVRVRFIGWRYGQHLVQQRILALLGPVAARMPEWVHVEFVPTSGHEAFLQEVAGLDWVIDSFPYTGGVTALEALALGVPFRTRAGRLFCERHAYSHGRFAGLEDGDINLRRVGALTAPPRPKSGRTLLPEACPRRDHVGLARALAGVFEGGMTTTLCAVS